MDIPDRVAILGNSAGNGAIASQSGSGADEAPGPLRRRLEGAGSGIVRIADVLGGEASTSGPAVASDAQAPSRDLDASRAFFRELLAGKKVPTPLPCAEPATRPLPVGGHGERRRALDARNVARLSELARDTETTIRTVVEGALAIVLSRHTGDDDVLFGTTRGYVRSQDDRSLASGSFESTVPVRARVADPRTVSEFLRELHERTRAARAHAPLTDVRAESEIPGDVPLFETLFVFESAELERTSSGDEESSTASAASVPRASTFPLIVSAHLTDRLALGVLYDRSRFRESVPDRLLESLEVVLERMGESPSAELGDIDVLPPEERRRILHDFNDTAAPFPDDVLVHELFEARAASEPDAIAVETRNARVTFGDLERRANRLAHALRERGAGPGERIGVLCRRGIGLVTALLGVAKSGAAYVPLDPAHPRERTAFMLAEARAKWVVTERALRELVPEGAVLVDDEDAPSRMPESRPVRAASPADSCYAIFTSGSTGKPKGVVLSHRAVVNTLDWVNATFGCGPGDRLLFVTSPCFDLSVYDVFGALGGGATLVVADESELEDPALLASLLVRERITIWNSAPAALQRVLPFVPEASRDAPLRLVLLSGDWIPLALPGAVRAAFPGARVVSLGGATEAAIWSNWYPVERLDPRWTSVPYGRPIRNARYHVLDRRQRPVPVGVPGDLYIGGVCLADGYLNRPELTAERFIRDPFRSDPRERLYRTGDLARYIDGGDLEFLGRADFQVKIRGYRVELGEVEAALAAIPEVAEAVCSTSRDASDQVSLVAYVVLAPGARIGERRVREILGGMLPEYMVPSRVVTLPALPLSSNGKIDRKALPAPLPRGTEPSFVAPRNETEASLQRIWQEILSEPSIGVNDDFFVLGGHSLLAVMLIARIKTALSVDVPLSQILASPTIAGLAEYVRQASPPARRARHLLTMNAAGSRPPLLLVAGIGGYAFTFRNFPRLFGRDQPVFALQSLGAEGTEPLVDHSVEEMAAIYEAEVVSACPEGPIVLGGFSFGMLPAFELAHRLMRRGRQVPFLVSLDGFAPGWPEPLPLGERIFEHVRTLFSKDPEVRRAYARGRFENLRTRIRARLGRDDSVDPLLPYFGFEATRRLARLWAYHQRAQARYRPEHVLPCELLLVRAAIPEKWFATQMDDPLYGWERHVKGPVAVVTLPGTHLTLLDPLENQVRVVEAIDARMSRFLESRR
jgi:amino acid adenylation domain-containing protein